MKKRIIRIVRMKIFLVLILASPLLVFNTIYAADVSSAILKSEITLASLSGSDQSHRDMTFPMSTNALTSLGLLNDDFLNSQLCVGGSACPEADEVLTTPTSWMQSIDDKYLVSTGKRSSTYDQYYRNCQAANVSNTTMLSPCGGSTQTDLFYTGAGVMQVGDEFWVIQETQPFNAMEITIETPWSQGGGGVLSCQWYRVDGHGTWSYTALTNVNDPSGCFTTPGRNILVKLSYC